MSNPSKQIKKKKKKKIEISTTKAMKINHNKKSVQCKPTTHIREINQCKPTTHIRENQNHKAT